MRPFLTTMFPLTILTGKFVNQKNGCHLNLYNSLNYFFQLLIPLELKCC